MIRNAALRTRDNGLRAASSFGGASPPNLFAVDPADAALSDSHVARASTYQTLERNERRLNALAQRGVRVVVNGCDALTYVLDQISAGHGEEEIQRAWALQVALLLDRIEREAKAV